MKRCSVLIVTILLCQWLMAQPSDKFEPLDVFDLEFVSDPQIAPDGEKVVYVRNFKDIMTDKNLSNLWIMDFDGKNHRPLTSGNQNDNSPRWSPDGSQLVYRSNKGGSSQLYLLWVAEGTEFKLTNVQQAPGSVAWSRDGKFLAFTMFVPQSDPSPIKMPGKPQGANWNDPPTYIDDMKYRSDGSGYVKPGNRQIFILSTDGGTPRQLTDENTNLGNPVWSADGSTLFFSANLNENADYDPLNSEIYSLKIADGTIKALTDRQGPDSNPTISPDGKTIAYTGFDDELLGYHSSKIYTMAADGSNKKQIDSGLDRSLGNIQWSNDGKSIFFQYTDEGVGKIASVDMGGKVTQHLDGVNGLSIGRPYAGGDFSVSNSGKFAYTFGKTGLPAELGVGEKSSGYQMTRLNDDLFRYKNLGSIEEIWWESSFDERKIQGWIVKPPNFDPNKKYPLILEIHGGPFSAYGPVFSAEVQLYASAGYVVFYTNPRGSTSYGAEFANLIHHNYPNQDYDDLISGVDAVLEKGYVDEDQLFVTGGSGGGVLSAWIVGHTDKFAAAVVAKPVINWYSFVLYADNPGFFYKYWFPGLPWDNLEHYMKRSPISYVGNVTTPTMLLTGESDFRTPIAETEQFYAGLKLNKVESAMVRIPGASHGIAGRPSNLIAKVQAILMWFDKYRTDK